MGHDKKHDRNDGQPVRQGDILGLGDVVPGTSTDIDSSFDRDVTRNSESIRDEDEDMRDGDTAYERKPGATGIDMGAGGTGTDVE